MLRALSFVVDPVGGFKGAVSLALTGLAVLRLVDVTCLLLWAVVCVLLLGAMFAYLADFRRWEEQRAAIASMGLVSVVFPAGVLAYFLILGPSFELPAAAATSSSWLLRLAARAAAAAAAGAPAGAAAAAAAGAGGLPAAVLKTAAAVDAVLMPWSGVLVALVGVCEDAVMLMAATLVWEVLGPLGDATWRGCVETAVEAGVVLECLGHSLMLLGTGLGWRQTWQRFWAQVRWCEHAWGRSAAAAAAAACGVWGWGDADGGDTCVGGVGSPWGRYVAWVCGDSGGGGRGAGVPWTLPDATGGGHGLETDVAAVLSAGEGVFWAQSVVLSA